MYRITLSAALLALLVMAGGPPSAEPQSQTLSEADLVGLLQQKLPASRIIALVSHRGIDFDFTPEVERQVRKAGAREDLVTALRRAAARHAREQPHGAALIIRTAPGNALVYLDAVPKGATDSQGELRLLDLKPGTCDLRISLSGYETYDKPIRVADHAQTVNVTLAPKISSPASPDGLAVGHNARSESPLPIPNVTVSPVKFYESEPDSDVDQEQRVYRSRFDPFTTRSIYWELDLQFPPPGRRIDFTMEAFWYKPDRSPMAHQTIPAFVNPDWESSWHSLGFGFAEPGHWIPGSYRVDLYYQKALIASGTFQIE